MKKKKADEQQLKELLLKVSQVTPEELLQQIKESPNSVVAARACCTMLFDEYFAQYLPAPSRGDMNDEDYQAQVQSYENIRENIRQIAFYWYIAGSHHPKHMERLIELLEKQPEGQSNQ